LSNFKTSHQSPAEFHRDLQQAIIYFLQHQEINEVSRPEYRLLYAGTAKGLLPECLSFVDK
jgi:hypothetical protein